MMFNSLKSRLWLTYALIIVLLLTAVGVGVLMILRNNPLLYRQPLIQLEGVANNTTILLAGTNDPAILKSQIKTAAGETGLRLALYQPDGKLIADSDEMSGTHFELIPPLIPSTAGEVRFVGDARGRNWVYTIKQIDNRYFLLAATRQPRLPLQLILRDELFKPLARAGLFAMLAAIALAILLGNWVEAPLQKLAKQSAAVSRGTAQPITPEGPAEVRQLFGAYNDMVTRLNASQKSQRDFVANVSHELKTPLTSIQGFAQAILDQKPVPPDETGQSARVILDEAQRMNKMVMGLLTLARLDAGIEASKKEAVDLQALLRNVLEKLAPQAQTAGVSLNEELESIPPLLADGENLTQVFVNLVENAIKFSNKGDQVWVTCHQVNHEVEVHVRDNGQGIPHEDQTRIFERFYQADKARSGGPKRGIGLGLAIASQMVKAMGGSITVESEPGAGCDFMVKLSIA
jgi:two-component system OmpR family sensor kinase